MPRLGDVIGSMLSDVARARVRSDIEAVRIAEAYSGDPLLKHLSVPRFRLPDLVVDLPVLVARFDDAASDLDAWHVAEPNATEVRQAVREALSQSGTKLSGTQARRAASAAARRAKEIFAAPNQLLMTPGRISDELADAAITALGATPRADISPETQRTLGQSLRASMTTLLATKIVPSPSLEVWVTAEDIKAHADSGNLIHLRLTIVEDAYEVVERDSGSGYYLTPE
jgi:hypothetical protein